MNELKLAVVQVEPCLSFTADNEAPEGVCEACGWLVEEHGVLFAAPRPATRAAA